MGGALVAAGREVGWASAGRSRQSAARAAAAGLDDRGDLGSLLRDAAVVLSICPPGAARQVAEGVARAGYAGTYVDANAIAPRTASEVAAIVRAAGARYVDGSLIGAPEAPGGPRLYLSGEGADEVAALFGGAAVLQRRLAADPFAASALKMAYAAWTKGSAALLLSAEEAAARAGLGEALGAEWAAIDGLGSRLGRARGDAREKGARWVGEMEEIAIAFEDLGLPGGFGAAAAAIFAAAEDPAQGHEEAP